MIVRRGGGVGVGHGVVAVVMVKLMTLQFGEANAEHPDVLVSFSLASAQLRCGNQHKPYDQLQKHKLGFPSGSCRLERRGFGHSRWLLNCTDIA